MPNSFRSLGYLSDDAESLRISIRSSFSAELESIRGNLRIALGELPCSEDSPTAGEYLVGLGMWRRAIESCQATVLLMEYGFLSSQFATLRTAYECLFIASGLWYGSLTLKRLEEWHNRERTLQARLLHTELQKLGYTAEMLHTLSFIKDDAAPRNKLSLSDTAHHAGLGLLYESSYRGLSLAGAHATPQSLRSHDSTSPEFAKDLQIKREHILKETIKCLHTGMERHRDALQKYCDAIKRSVSNTPSGTPESM